MSDTEYTVRLAGSVRPPEDMMAVARAELSADGFARLMDVTAGEAPTPHQLVREVEYEREGRYPPEAPAPLTNAKLLRLQTESALLAAAMIELSPGAFTELMTRIGQRAPSAHELVEAVEAERARGAPDH